jgi:cytochrome P450
MLPPRDAVAAVTHPDPYPWYAELRQRPFHRDETLGLWIAADAGTVTAAFDSAACRVRPVVDPVPQRLQGTTAGAIFGRLVRMTDGEAQARAKRAVAATLASATPETVAMQARHQAAALVGDGVPTPAGLDALLFALAIHTVGGLLGFDPARLPEISRLMRSFVAGLAPGATAEAIAGADAAAADLLAAIQPLLDRPDTGGLARRLQDEAAQAGGIDPAVVAANATGFLFQSHDAGAGLLGNAILALGTRPELRRRVAAERSLLPEVVQEVLRFDPPAQNTRRFVAEATEIAGQALQPGDAILVVVAAANRDPAVNSDPDRFDPERADRRMFSFGHGRHVCPGDAIAAAIAVAGLDVLLDRLPDWPEKAAGYRPSVNARIPTFG